MLTLVRTPRDIFFLPQRLLVPLFQRPYVWSEDAQWAPLWSDVMRLAERRLRGEPVAPHFLGAVVLQQQAVQVGSLAVRTVIDGQQRLTTLQLLLDAVHAQLEMRQLDSLARQLQDLVENPAHFTTAEADRFKVWPTNRDRPAFNEVMSAGVPVDYSTLKHRSSRMARAHEFFSTSASAWLTEGEIGPRAAALVEILSSQLLLVSIDLLYDEDAQEIFETLNARGTPLTPADLIKNLVFQRLEAGADDIELAYQRYWAEFETPFWETEVSAGRVLYSRSSLFLNQWLISKTFRDVPAREVFSAFKRYISERSDGMRELLPSVQASADLYRNLLERAAARSGPLSRVEMFVYRTSTLESELVKPFLLWLLDPELPAVPRAQSDKALAALESWMVRRVLVRASTKGYNRFFIDLLTHVNSRERALVGDAVEAFLGRQDSPTAYWPGDAEVRRELTSMPAYWRLRRGRLRMVLEAVEDYKRGWANGKPLHEQPVVRGTCTIEHIMPQEWRTNWPADPQGADPEARDALVQTLGNLTLVTQSLNSKVSNGPWHGEHGKRTLLNGLTSILLTREVVDRGADGWDEARIRQRTENLISDILKTWEVPVGHTGKVAGAVERASHRVEVADLVRAGLVPPGQTLFARPRALAGRTCAVSEDGRVFVNDTPYSTLSAAARAVSGSQSEPGWWFWLVGPDTDRSMSTLRDEYLQSLDEDEADLVVEGE
ncbi:GmrSD restriction endonuclease domain-containing protein [Naasia aerilata]|uniref:DUF262 domain-containing protein n=1 Tax=Naasia aerilata TaxID=1162966 RepID=A0ABN6XQA5_9MICO|nr:DUF262 domain-containing protein [Naasia aerilata]BDZ47189.1 hypothetical protein GCM10025866_30980 [Naasia aerilata]